MKESLEEIDNETRPNIIDVNMKALGIPGPQTPLAGISENDNDNDKKAPETGLLIEHDKSNKPASLPAGSTATSTSTTTMKAVERNHPTASFCLTVFKHLATSPIVTLFLGTAGAALLIAGGVTKPEEALGKGLLGGGGASLGLSAMHAGILFFNRSKKKSVQAEPPVEQKTALQV